MRPAFTAVLMLIASFSIRAADPENPFRQVKVGDWAEFRMSLFADGYFADGQIKMAVSSRDDKEVVLDVTGTINRTPVPGRRVRIDLAKPFDPLSTAGLPTGSEVKIERLGDDREMLKLAETDFDCLRSKSKVATRFGDTGVDAQASIWTAKNAPLAGIVKMELSAIYTPKEEAKQTKIEAKVTFELVGSGPPAK